MADDFATFSSGLDSPAAHAFAIATSDTVDLSQITRAVYVGGAGDVKIKTVSGETVTFSGAPVGMILPVRVARVFTTGTTATLLVGLY